MNHNYPGYKQGEGNRPSHNIDPRKKDKGWILEMVKSIYRDFNRYSPESFYNGRDRYDGLINYVQGLQSERQYRERIDSNKSGTKNLTAVNHSKRPLNLISKYFRIIKNKLADVKLDASITPQSQFASNQMREYKLKLEAAMTIKKIMDEYGQNLDSEITKQYGIPSIPLDTDELEIDMSMSEPMLISKDVEKTIAYVNEIDNLDQKYEESDYFLVTTGIAGIHEKVDAQGITYSEKVDPRDLMVGYSKTEDFRDISEVGQFRMITMSDLMEEDVNDEITEEMYEKISKDFAGKYGNDNSFNSTVTFHKHVDNDLYSKTRVLVLDTYFYSWDEEVKEKKKNKHGNWRIYKKDPSYYKGKEDEYKKKHPDRKLTRTRIQNVYKCTWIVDSDICYNSGLLRNMARTKNQPNKTQLPIKLIAPLMQNGRTSSIIEELIKYEDMANLMWNKMEEAIAHSRPPGFEFDVDAINAATEGLTGQWKNFDFVMEMMVKHNIIPTSGKDINGMAHGRKPFQELPGGLGSEFRGYVEGLQFAMQMMESISGLGSVASGGDVKYTGKRTAELAVETADYSIRHLIKGKGRLFEQHMRLRANLLLDAIADGTINKYIHTFGDRATKIINKNVTLYDYDIKVEFRPTAADWQDVYLFTEKALQVPLDQGGIDTAQAMKIKEVETIKEARALLYTFIRRNKAEAERKQAQMAEQKAQLDQQSAMVAAQQRQQQMDMDIALKAQILNMETEQKRLIMNEEFNYDLELEKFKALVKSDHQKDQGDIDKEMTEIKARYNQDRLKTNTTQIGG